MRAALPRRAIIAFIAALASGAHAEKNLADNTLDAKSGTRIEISSVFDPMPPSGYAPVHVVATNGGAKAARWALTFACIEQNYRVKNRFDSDFVLEIEPHATASSMLLVPMAARYGPNGTSSENRETQIHLDAGSWGERSFSTYDEHSENFPAIAISKALAFNSITALKDELEKRRKSSSGTRSSGSNLFGSEYLPADLPEDWRGYSGFDALMIANAEWSSLKPGARLAILQWVRLGGRLHIYLSPGANSEGLGIPAAVLSGGKGWPLGQVKLIGWNGDRLDAKETVGRYWGNPAREALLTEKYSTQRGGDAEWGLLQALGKRSFASWQVLVFLVVFGILVGPVNLFVLAPASRRHRLFVSTPLLSLGASVVMIVILLLQDGLGGHGRRFVVVNVEPGDAAAYVTQEQASRTGILLSAGFDMKVPSLVEALALPDKPWVKLKNNYNTQPLQVRQSGSAHSGNFFQSRAEQGQLLHAVVSARARLEWRSPEGAAGGAAPEIVSALGFTVDEVFFVDEGGRVWKSTAPGITGQTLKWEISDMAALRKWWKAACSAGGQSLRTQLEEQTATPRAVFFAKAKKAPEFVLDTLKSIHWDEDQVVIFGSVAKP